MNKRHITGKSVPNSFDLLNLRSIKAIMKNKYNFPLLSVLLISTKT